MHNFISAVLGGYLVFGSNNKINMQVTTRHTMVCYPSLDKYVSAVAHSHCLGKAVSQKGSDKGTNI